MTMKNPSHPGEIIRELCLEPLGLTVTQAAQGLGVTRKTLSLLVNGHAGLSPEMAVGCPRLLAAVLRVGYSFRCSMTSPRSESRPRRLTSNRFIPLPARNLDKNVGCVLRTKNGA